MPEEAEGLCTAIIRSLKVTWKSGDTLAVVRCLQLLFKQGSKLSQALFLGEIWVPSLPCHIQAFSDSFSSKPWFLYLREHLPHWAL